MCVWLLLPQSAKVRAYNYNSCHGNLLEESLSFIFPVLLGMLHKRLEAKRCCGKVPDVIYEVLKMSKQN